MNMKIAKQIRTASILVLLIGGLLALAGGFFVANAAESISGLIAGIAICAAGGLTSGTGGIVLSISIDMQKELEKEI